MFLAVMGFGAGLAGFVTGLAGFGTGLFALGFWLHMIEPSLAAPLVVICSVAGQSRSLLRLRRDLDFSRAWPFLIGGLAGVPLGVAAWGYLDSALFKFLIGTFLVIYSSLMLSLPRLPGVTWGGIAADGVVGLGGGILGGLAGLSGPLPTVWCGLRGWTKDQQRATFQIFNLAVLFTVLAAYGISGFLTADIGLLSLLCVPCVILGAGLGARLYLHFTDRQFRLIVLWLLMLSGITLSVSNWP